MTSTLALSAALSVMTGIIYAYVGLRLGHRKVSIEARAAQGLFSTFWFGLAFSSIVTALTVALYLTDRLQMWLYAAIQQAQIFAIVFALFALIYYLIYVYTGTSRWLVPLAVAYFLAWLVLVGLIEWVPTPDRLADDGWQVTTEPVIELSAWVGVIFIVALVGPQLAAAVAYGRLYGKATDNTQRYRIALVSGTIILWFGTSLLGALFRAEGDAWHLTTRLLGVMAALLILAAYLPPPSLKAKWGLRSITDEGQPTTAVPT